MSSEIEAFQVKPFRLGSCASSKGSIAYARKNWKVFTVSRGDAATRAELDGLGLVLDSDPRRVSTGSAQTGDPAADEPHTDDAAADAETDPAQADQQD
jgi:hypothetical protein